MSNYFRGVPGVSCKESLAENKIENLWFQRSPHSFNMLMANSLSIQPFPSCSISSSNHRLHFCIGFLSQPQRLLFGYNAGCQIQSVRCLFGLCTDRIVPNLATSFVKTRLWDALHQGSLRGGPRFASRPRRRPICTQTYNQKIIELVLHFWR